MDLDTNSITITGTIREQAGTISAGATNNITLENGYYEVPAVAAADADVTTTVVIPDGTYGGERFTIVCTAVGNYRPPVGPSLIGKVLLQGTWAGETPPTADITGAIASGAGVSQNVMFEFIWAGFNGDPAQGIGWHYLTREQ
jgi:hypothetical protein